MQVSAAQEAGTPPKLEGADRAIMLLTDALEILDCEMVAPEFGARLQEIIAGLTEHKSVR